MTDLNTTDLKTVLLHSAYRLFTDLGYRGTSIRRLADTCSCNVASVYYHFGSKENLFRAVLTAHSPVTAVAEAIERDPPPLDGPPARAVRHLMGTVYHTVKDRLPSYYLILIDVREFGGANLRVQLAEHIQRLGAAPAQSMARLLSRLPLRSWMSPGAFVMSMMATVFVVLLRERFVGLPQFVAGQGVTFESEGDPEEALDRACEAFLYGALERGDGV